MGQAKTYAGKLAIRFTYATNGRGIYKAAQVRVGEMFVTPLGRVPAGTPENSPALERWGPGSQIHDKPRRGERARGHGLARAV